MDLSQYKITMSRHCVPHLASNAETLVDVVGAVELGIIDQPLPSDGGPGLLEVDTHDEDELAGVALDERSKLGGCVHGKTNMKKHLDRQ